PALLADIRRARPRRRTVATGAAIAVALVVGMGLLLRRGPTFDAARVGELTALRQDLNARLDAIDREVERLRRTGDAAGADRMGAELAAFRLRAAGAS